MKVRAKPIRCPGCSRFASRRAPECTGCESFRCVGCRRWVPWDDGADDDMPEHCAACWAAAHPEAA